MRQHVHIKYKEENSKPKEFFERKNTNLKRQHLQDSRTLVRAARKDIKVGAGLLQSTPGLGPDPGKSYF